MSLEKKGLTSPSSPRPSHWFCPSLVAVLCGPPLPLDKAKGRVGPTSSGQRRPGREQDPLPQEVGCWPLSYTGEKNTGSSLMPFVSQGEPSGTCTVALPVTRGTCVRGDLWRDHQHSSLSRQQTFPRLACPPAGQRAANRLSLGERGRSAL